ncbi:unnamed protein product [Haemonchus placei]|uniref:Uncharacterized protein n=1 Tax=Haemonchus placei TaxID=6290 RepID=A0A3P7VX08_HAEPC|nr:unnamed protein product [Haemonchus placei]
MFYPIVNSLDQGKLEWGNQETWLSLSLYITKQFFICSPGNIQINRDSFLDCITFPVSHIKRAFFAAKHGLILKSVVQYFLDSIDSFISQQLAFLFQQVTFKILH